MAYTFAKRAVCPQPTLEPIQVEHRFSAILQTVGQVFGPKFKYLRQILSPDAREWFLIRDSIYRFRKDHSVSIGSIGRERSNQGI